ncbi:putative outer membrane protein, partial [Salmonella enterica subsp. enterica serovar Enteritidis str. SL909]
STTGTLQGGSDSVMMRVNGQASTNGPLFWLENGGQRVKLTGAKK